MGKDHHNHQQRSFNKDRNFNKRGNFQKGGKRNNEIKDKSWLTDKRLLETEVGIDKYVSDFEGFQGIIKAR